MCLHESRGLRDAANEIFAPADSELDWARRIIGAYEAARAAGQAVIAVDGQLGAVGTGEVSGDTAFAISFSSVGSESNV